MACVLGDTKMEDFVKKLSEYQFLNFLLAGTVFVAILAKTTEVDLASDNLIVSFFTAYFIGLVISRIGSIVTEPLLKKLRIVRFAPYTDYLSAVKKDPKIDILSQENNMYRTLISTFVVYILVFLVYHNAAPVVGGRGEAITYALAIALTILFILAYRKQTHYITKRVNKAIGEQDGKD